MTLDCKIQCFNSFNRKDRRERSGSVLDSTEGPRAEALPASLQCIVSLRKTH